VSRTKQKIGVGGLIVLMFLFIFWPTPEPIAKESFAGDSRGTIRLGAVFLDDDMKPVDTRGIMTVLYEKGLDIVVPTDERVRYLQVTVDWDVSRVAEGLDPETFMLDAWLNVVLKADNGLEDSWMWKHDVSPVGVHDISSGALNGIAQWTLSLRQDLELESWAKSHSPDVRTDFDIIMELEWDATIHDTVRDEVVSLSGPPLLLSVECYYVRGFKTVPRLG